MVMQLSMVALGRAFEFCELAMQGQLDGVHERGFHV